MFFYTRASKESLKNIDDGQALSSCGSSSTDLGGPVRMASLIYCYRDNLQKLLEAVRDQTTLTHAGPGVVDGAIFLAGSCYHILHGETPRNAFQKMQNETKGNPDLYLRLHKCLEQNETPTIQQIKEFGQMCSINAALPGAVYTVLKNEDNLKEALIETVMAGGDSAARGMAVGMILGAYLGPDAIPASWLDGLTRYQQITDALEKLP